MLKIKFLLWFIFKLNRFASSDNDSGSICVLDSDKNMTNVLVLYTGGTIGMMKTGASNSLSPVKNRFFDEISLYSELSDKSFSLNGESLALPYISGEVRTTLYTIKELDPLLDSSNLAVDDWIRIAEELDEVYDDFDAFVVLHGTDTMPYTASALSFIIEKLDKTVVVTGSQIPIFQDNTDGIDNFQGALFIAGNYHIPEVSVYFHGELYRGNRVLKIHSTSFNGFSSPNYLPLIESGRTFDTGSFETCSNDQVEDPGLEIETNLNHNVVLIKVYPDISTDIVENLLKSPTEGIVLESYGAGNMPTNRTDLMEVFKEASDRGVIIINISQCLYGGVYGAYETGQLEEFGILSGRDLTPVAAFTKLAYVLGISELSVKEKRVEMLKSLRGEMKD